MFISDIGPHRLYLESIRQLGVIVGMSTAGGTAIHERASVGTLCDPPSRRRKAQGGAGVAGAGRPALP